MIYKVETIKDGTEKYFFIRNLETMSIEELPSKYLMHKIKCKRSPNTVKRTAFSICNIWQRKKWNSQKSIS